MNLYTLDEILGNELDVFANDLFNGEDFSETNWKPATKKIKHDFPIVRRITCDRAKMLFEINKRDVKKELISLVDRLELMWWDQDGILELGHTAQAYDHLAGIVGLVDFIKWLYAGKETKKEPAEDWNIEDIQDWIWKIVAPRKRKKKKSKVDFTTRQVALYNFYSWTGRPEMRIDLSKAEEIIKSKEFKITNAEDLVKKYNAIKYSEKRTKFQSRSKANSMRNDILVVMPRIKNSKGKDLAILEAESLKGLIIELK